MSSPLMRGLLSPWLALLVVCLSVTAAAAQDYGETVEVNLVTVDVEARDAAGKPVVDLERQDFTVFEDGKRVELTQFERAARSTAMATTPAAPPSASPASPANAEAPAPAGDGTRLIVYVDNLHLHPETRTRALERVRAFFARGLHPGEQVMVASQDLGLTTRLDFSSDLRAIDAALHEVETLPARGGEDDRARQVAYSTLLTLHQIEPCAMRVAEPVKSYAQSTRDEVLRTLGRLRFLINSLAGLPGRKALLYVSDGIPQQPGQDLFQVLFEICGGGAATSGAYIGTAPAPSSGDRARRGGGEDSEAPSRDKPDSPGIYDADLLGPSAYNAKSAAIDAASYDTSLELRRLAAHASANRVALYTLRARGLTTAASADAAMGGESRLLQLPAVAAVAEENPKGSLVYLAKETGGRAIIDTNDFDAELARMRENLATYYALGYQPAHQGDGKEHRIEVRVRRPGLQLAYRRVYRDKPPLEQVVDRTLAALVHGHEENPLGVSVEMAPAKPLDNGRSLVTARLLIPLFRLATINRDDMHEGKLRVMVVAGDPDGATTPLRQVEVPVRVPHAQVLTAFGQKYAYEVGMEMTAGEHTIAFAVQDELGATTSFLRQRVVVPPAASAALRQ